MSGQADPLEQMSWIIQGHIYAGIRIARMRPQVIAGNAAMNALAASLAATCMQALGLVPEQPCQSLADILGITPGPDLQERLARALREIDQGGTEGHPDLDAIPQIGR